MNLRQFNKIWSQSTWKEHTEEETENKEESDT